MSRDVGVIASGAALPRSHQQVAVLRDLEGLSGEETCTTLGLEPAAMKARLHRARASLRALRIGPPRAR